MALAFAGAALPANGVTDDFWAAARKGDVEAVKVLLAKGVNVNAKTAYGATALSFAADKGHVEVIKVLLAAKADPNVKDTFYKATPMEWAISRSHAEIVRLLVEAGAEDADTALHFAVQKGNLELAKVVLGKAKIKQADLDKALAATPKNKAEIIDVLTKAGAKAAESSVKVDAAILKSHVGSYRNDELMLEYKVVLQSDQLVIKSGSFTLYVLKPVDETTFHPVSKDSTTIVFQKDKGNVTGILEKSGTKENLFKRLAARPELPLANDVEPPVTIKAANWPSFRGPHASGVADGQFPPTTWDAESRRNIRWRTRVPGLGHSCPVVWGERIFLTTAKNDADKADLKAGLYGNVDSVHDTSPHTFHVLCLDKASGKILWDEIAHKGVPKVKRHTKATHANSTCATDGTHVVACFGSEGLYCYDTLGKLLWKKELGVLDSGWFYDPDYQWGFGSSPIIYENMVIIQCDAGKNAFIAAYDVDSGERIWLTARDELPSWGTPTIIETGTGPELVTNATKFVRGYDPKTGNEVWRLGKNSEITVPTPIFAHGLIFVTSGYRPVRPIYAIRMGARGDITLAKEEKSSGAIAWSIDKAGTYMPTPIVYCEHLYTCSNDGIVTCYDAKSGKRLWWERLGSDGGFTASPVAADGKLYFTSEEGQTYVVKAGAEFNLLATNVLGDPCLTTPAISDGMLFVRTQRYLFGIGLERQK
jgi:outer membrane protein assembly factor BamB